MKRKGNTCSFINYSRKNCVATVTLKLCAAYAFAATSKCCFVFLKTNIAVSASDTME